MIYSCAGPAYHLWVTDWPPLGAALLGAAQTSGALLVTTGNLYGYGAVYGPMTEGLPLRPNTEKGQVRVRIWNEALEAHRAGLDPHGRGAQLGLPRRRCGDAADDARAAEGARGQTGPGPGRPGRAAQLDLHRRRGPHLARRRSGRRVLGPGLGMAPTGPPKSFREVASRAAQLAGVLVRLSVMPTRCCGSVACSIRWPARRGRPSTSSGSRSCWTPRPPGRRSGSVRHHWTTRCTRQSLTCAPGHDGACAEQDREPPGPQGQRDQAEFTLTTCGWVKKGLPLCLIGDSGTGSPTCPGFGRLTETFPQVKPWRTHP